MRGKDPYKLRMSAVADSQGRGTWGYVTPFDLEKKKKQKEKEKKETKGEKTNTPLQGNHFKLYPRKISSWIRVCQRKNLYKIRTSFQKTIFERIFEKYNWQH